MHDIHCPWLSRMQPIVRFMYSLQLLHVVGMLIRRETTQKRVQTLLSAKHKTTIICLHATWTTLLVLVVVLLVVVVVVVVVTIAIVAGSNNRKSKSSSRSSRSSSSSRRRRKRIMIIIITIAVITTLLIPLGTGIRKNSSYQHRSGINCGTAVHGSMAATIKLTTIMRVANRRAMKNSDDRTTLSC